MKITDELLNAYVDGELEPGDVPAVEAEILRSPALAAEVARLRDVNATMRGFGAVIDDLPLPDDVTSLFGAPPQEAAVIPFPAARRSGFWKRVDRFALPMAASIALVIGLAAGRGLAPESAPQSTVIAAIKPASPLHTLLETGSAGDVRAISSEGRADVRLSFTSSDGSFCREVEIEEAARLVRAVACREGGASTRPDWRIRMASATARSGAVTGYRTASAEDDAAFDAAVNMIMSGDALGPDDERRLIERGWKR